MIRRPISTIAAMSLMWLVVLASTASADQTADVKAVEAVNQAFYAALSGRDAKAMEALWANKPYVANIGPLSKSIAVGYENAVVAYWQKTFENISELDVTLTSAPHVQTDGIMAVVIGTESAQLTLAGTGEAKEFNAFVTNTFEKINDEWRMVSHHAGIIPD